MQSDRRGGGFAPTAATARAPAKPPERPRNALGQPLNEDGRPIGPPDKVHSLRNRPIESGEVPTTPPRFSDPEKRAQFKRWWVDELARRIEVYQTLEPRDDYPSPETTRRTLDSFYDAAEPRGPNEPIKQAFERRQAWRTLWRRIVTDFGVPLKTLSSRGGDPQYGATPEPPVQPDGADQSGGGAPPEAPVSDTVPPGRGADEPGGLDPLQQPGTQGGGRN